MDGNSWRLAPPSHPAPERHTTQWFDRDGPLRLTDLRGKVVVLLAFGQAPDLAVGAAIAQLLAE